MKNVAFIPVRGGSKSIPEKNIKVINGKPLVYWATLAAVKCNEIDRVFVSTDSLAIKDTVEEFGFNKVKVIPRSKRASTDIATTESVMLEFAHQYEFENIVLIQATSPLIGAEDLQRGLMKFALPQYNSILSGVRQKRFIWRENKDGTAFPVNYDVSNRPRRQEMDGYLVENGAFYITTRNDLLRSKCRVSGKVGIVEMSAESYFEIDEPSDWEIVEKLFGSSRCY